MRALCRDNFDPATFNIEDCCTSELLERARASDILRQKLKAFYDLWFGLDAAERHQVRRAFIHMNRVPQQVSGNAPRITIEDLPERIRAVVQDLFVYLYENALTKTKVRSHWEQFYIQLQVKVCPFCGIEPLHHSQLYKQDYDHLLCKKIYPFASVNLRNLVPCGSDCNTHFKHDKDVIYNISSGQRRRAFFPFRDHGIVVSVMLTGSRIPDRDDDPGDWRITFQPDSEEVRTWVEVFELEARYRLEVFNTHYDRWREDFRDWIAPQTPPVSGWTAASIKHQMEAFAQTLSSDRFREKRFLKYALFRFLIDQDDQSFFAALAAQMNTAQNN
jgi:hypothetical protein